MPRLTVEGVKAEARAVGLFLYVGPRTYANYNSRYVLYRIVSEYEGSGRYVASSQTLEGIVRHIRRAATT